MTAPGQEPDEVMTGKPAGEQDRAHERPEPDAEAARDAGVERPGREGESYDPRSIGDLHMPEDLRKDESAREARIDEDR